LKVALDAARGLAFLHSAETKVIYRDFKTSNILLDSVCELLTFCIQYAEKPFAYQIWNMYVV